MQERPESSFRCGPLALRQILHSTNPQNAADAIILDSASTTNGCSLAQVAALSRKLGMNYQMAFRGVRPSSGAATSARASSPSVIQSPSTSGPAAPGDGRTPLEVSGDFVVPSVVHWKAGHYAAIIRREGDRLSDPGPDFPQ